MNYSEIIQYLINKYNLKSYLELGVTNGYNYSEIACENKECCDVVESSNLINIKYDITYLMPSDEMFAKMPIDKKYDLIFIDAMHDEEYVDKDIVNALKHLNKNGFICVHDTLPINAMAQCKYDIYDGVMAWNGDVWKSITKLQNNNLEFYTVDILCGLTIIKYKENPFHLEVPQYYSTIRYDHVFKDNKLTDQGKFIMHAISIDEFLNKF